MYNNYYLSQCSDSLASTPSALRPQGESVNRTPSSISSSGIVAMLQRQQCSLQKIIKQQDELNKLVGQTVKRVMVLEQQLEQIQEKKNLQVHHVKKENVM